MKELICDIFLKHFGEDPLIPRSDAAILPASGETLAFTTDSFVVDPLFFPGGDIGKLAVVGTINDLAVCGARPAWLSAAFILEENLPVSILERVVRSMAAAASRAGVRIVTGDTKVVPAGKCDKLFITTSGIGFVKDSVRYLAGASAVRPGDLILLNGPPGEHGMAILQARKQFPFRSVLRSDCASLYPLIRKMMKVPGAVHFMRDATRGGVATVLHEISGQTGFGIEISERSVPASLQVRAFCEILGFDPLYIANEGKVVVIAGRNEAEKILGLMRSSPLGRQASVIGEVTAGSPGRVVLRTANGGLRVLDELTGDQLPRIC